MNHLANPSRLAFTVCLLLGMLLLGVARPSRARAAEGAQPVWKEEPSQKKSQPGAAYGIYLAVVKSRPDPHMRVQIEIPSLNITEWAQACVPVGSKAAPPLNSGVWVMFEQGDTHRPVWIGVPGT